MKLRFTELIILIVIVIIAATPLVSRAAESVDWAPEKSPAKTVEQQQVDEYNTIMQAYLRVVKYYNKKLTDAQAMRIASLLLYYSDKHDLDPRLVVAVIAVESRFQPRAVSPKGAMGLGQLMPGTAKSLGVNNAFDVKQNIFGTTKYLRMQMDRWKNSEDTLDRILASYNAGPEAVKKYKGIPPYRETRNYVKKVKKLYHFFVYGT